MPSERYYVDTCVWLNLFNKEENPATGYRYWGAAQDFFDRVMESEEAIILISPVVLQEIKRKLGNAAYETVEQELNENDKILSIQLTDHDKADARKLESQYHFNISFGDLLHLILSRRFGATLVTRDRQLMDISNENQVTALYPEAAKVC